MTCLTLNFDIFILVAEYKDNGLMGKSLYEKALVRQWIAFTDNEVTPPLATWIYPILGFMPFIKPNTIKAQNDLKTLFEVLDKYLKYKTFLVGDRCNISRYYSSH